MIFVVQQQNETSSVFKALLSFPKAIIFLLALLIGNSQVSADINIQDDTGYTSLHRAVFQGYVERVNELLEQGADISLRPTWKKRFENYQYSILEMVPRNKLDTIGVELLLAGADANEVLPNGDGLLIRSIVHNKGSLFTWLLKNGVTIDSFNKGGDTPLIRLIKKHGSMEMFLKPLIENGADSNRTNNSGESAISLAKGNMYITMKLRELGVDVDVSPDELLKHAISGGGGEELFFEALDKGANPNYVIEPDGISLLIMALMGGKKGDKGAKYLINRGASVDFIGTEKLEPYLSPLTLAIKGDSSYEVIETIVKQTKNINKICTVPRIEMGYTALDVAVSKGNKDIINLLTQSGAVSAVPVLPTKTFATNRKLAKQHVQKFIDFLSKKKCKDALKLAAKDFWFDRMYLSGQQWLKHCPEVAAQVVGFKATETYYPKDSKNLIRLISMGSIKGLNLEKIILVDTQRGEPSNYANWSFILSCTATRCTIVGIDDSPLKGGRFSTYNKLQEAGLINF